MFRRKTQEPRAGAGQPPAAVDDQAREILRKPDVLSPEEFAGFPGFGEYPEWRADDPVARRDPRPDNE